MAALECHSGQGVLISEIDNMEFELIEWLSLTASLFLFLLSLSSYSLSLSLSFSLSVHVCVCMWEGRPKV